MPTPAQLPPHGSETPSTGFNFFRFYFTASGRVNRNQWWLYFNLPFGVAVVVIPLLLLAAGKLEAAEVAFWLFFIAMVWPAHCGQVKRLHDRGRSAWWVLISLIPILGPIWLLVELGFLAGTPLENRYGTPPL